jgi:hypothetical protein
VLREAYSLREFRPNLFSALNVPLFLATHSVAVSTASLMCLAVTAFAAFAYGLGRGSGLSRFEAVLISLCLSFCPVVLRA